jgi:hypothetical protein
MSDIKVCRIDTTSPPPCRGRVREGVEAMYFHDSTSILAFPLQGGRNGFGYTDQFAGRFSS